MGCSSSTGSNADDGGAYKPDVKMTVGSQVRWQEKCPRLIFLLGGPGSKKGFIVDNLVQTFGFKLVSLEDLILLELPKKLKMTNHVDGIDDIKQIVRDKPSLLSLSWTLEHLERHLEGDLQATYLVDVIPNLKWMLLSDTLIKNPTDELQELEKKYPIAFALNLAIKESDVIKKIKPLPAVGEVQPAEGQQTDEVDSSRTEKRAKLYETSAKSWLHHFELSDRLVSIDMSSTQPQHVYDKLRQFFIELGATSVRTVNSIVLFGFDEQELSDVNIDYYGMSKVKLQSVVADPMASTEQLISDLCKHLENCTETESFAVELDGTSIKKEASDKCLEKATLFLNDIEQTTLDSVLHCTPSKGRPQNNKKFKAIMSTEGDICLFPEDTHNSTCKHIAQCMAKVRQR
ncbi:uncharacterized protein LOC106157192 [Lingula anatina]|uniref:Uncharacterized protein LOC106157192 n=1 Tax=Lingula anatina TaxID=7574 RepID=A0A1S3HRN9_LINAN|nr:uncharacterized protein LOC106157192 [Lingula anatina]|eukprot:XP_013388216.1 uncharacterized protein LOC106157192 [Lingula anatina]